MCNETDREIIIRIRRGDKEAYKIIVVRYMKRVFFLTSRVGYDRKFRVIERGKDGLNIKNRNQNVSGVCLKKD